MEKLNDLILLVNSKNNPFDNYSTVKDETILAIAKAFRALEQRAEAAEADHDNVISQSDDLYKRLMAAEAKLAEREENSLFGHLEKCSEIVARWPEWKRNGADAIKFIEGLDEFEVGYLNGHSEACKNRPAPAINVADLVPDEMTPKQASRSYGGEVIGYRDGFNACISEIMRNIEEAK